MAEKKFRKMRAITQGSGWEVIRTIAAGAADGVNIPITGITKRDRIISVIEWDTGVPTDLTAEAVIFSAGNIRLTTTDTTGNYLDIIWLKRGR